MHARISGTPNQNSRTVSSALIIDDDDERDHDTAVVQELSPTHLPNDILNVFFADDLVGTTDVLTIIV